MSSNNDNRDNYPHSAPIPIGGNSLSRRRGLSFSSSDSSPASPPGIQTPLSANFVNKIATSPSATSPIYSYFMNSSPSKSNTYPFRNGSFSGAAPVFEDEEGSEVDAHPSLHARRATTAWGGNSRTSGIPPPVPEAQQVQTQRGAGVLRRLSLGGGFKPPTGLSPRPGTPPPTAVATSPPAQLRTPTLADRKPRRATTLAVKTPEKPKRVPSPMGERILKGHFDGFN